MQEQRCRTFSCLSESLSLHLPHSSSLITCTTIQAFHLTFRVGPAGYRHCQLSFQHRGLCATPEGLPDSHKSPAAAISGQLGHSPGIGAGH